MDLLRKLSIKTDVVVNTNKGIQRVTLEFRKGYENEDETILEYLTRVSEAIDAKLPE